MGTDQQTVQALHERSHLVANFTIYVITYWLSSSHMFDFSLYISGKVYNEMYYVYENFKTSTKFKWNWHHYQIYPRALQFTLSYIVPALYLTLVYWYTVTELTYN